MHAAERHRESRVECLGRGDRDCFGCRLRQRPPQSSMGLPAISPSRATNPGCSSVATAAPQCKDVSSQSGNFYGRASSERGERREYLGPSMKPNTLAAPLPRPALIARAGIRQHLRSLPRLFRASGKSRVHSCSPECDSLNMMSSLAELDRSNVVVGARPGTNN